MRSNRDDDWDDEAPPPPPFADAPPPPPDVLPQGEVYDWYVAGARPARGRQRRRRGHPADPRRQLRAGVPQRPGGAGPRPVRLRDVRRGRAELRLDHLDQPGRRLRAVRPGAGRGEDRRPAVRRRAPRAGRRHAPGHHPLLDRVARRPGGAGRHAGDPAGPRPHRRRALRRRPARPRRRGLPRPDADPRRRRGARRGPDGRDAAGLRHQQRRRARRRRSPSCCRGLGVPADPGRGRHLLAGRLPGARRAAAGRRDGAGGRRRGAARAAARARLQGGRPARTTSRRRWCRGTGRTSAGASWPRRRSRCAAAPGGSPPTWTRPSRRARGPLPGNGALVGVVRDRDRA